MKVTPQGLEGVLLIEPQVFGDPRGYFKETYQAERYGHAGIPMFVQDNLSRSGHGILRGLHLQNPHGQGKLVSVIEGEVFDVVVDVRVGSPSFGQWLGLTLSGENHRQLYIPPGFAHGFCVTGEYALFFYKCTELYHPEHELGIAYDDPALGIGWPIQKPLVGAKDQANKRLSEIDKARLPHYRSPS